MLIPITSPDSLHGTGRCGESNELQLQFSGSLRKENVPPSSLTLHPHHAGEKQEKQTDVKTDQGKGDSLARSRFIAL